MIKLVSNDGVVTSGTIQLASADATGGQNDKALAYVNAMDSIVKVCPIIFKNGNGNSFDVINGMVLDDSQFTFSKDSDLNNASISINFNDDANSIKEIIPKYSKIITIINGSSSNYNVLFNSTNKKPYNHQQWVIASGRMAEKGYQKVYCHGYTLVEPIYLTQKVYSGTHSFTNITNIQIQTASTGLIDYFKKDKTNLYSILQRQLAITGYKTSKEDTSWLNKIAIMDSDLLKANGVGTNESFTSSTLYDSLIKIGQYINRIPKLYFNPTWNGTSVSTSDDDKEFLLYYEEKEEATSTITLGDFRTNSVGYTVNANQSNNADKVVCDASNIESADYVFYPSASTWFLMTGAENEITLTSSSKLSLKLPYKIRRVDYIELKQYQPKVNTNAPSFFYRHNAIYFCYEYYYWLQLDDAKRKSSFYFKDGTNEIIAPANNIMIANVQDSYRYLYRVRYLPLYEAKLSSGKGTIENIINQSDSMINGNNFGNYLDNYARESDNNDIIINKVCNDSELYMAGTVISNGADKYIITKTAITVLNNNNYQVQYILNLNNVKRAEMIGASSYKEITSTDLNKAYDRRDEIDENEIKVRLDYNLIKDITLNLNYITNFKVALANFVSSIKGSSDMYFANDAMCKLSYPTIKKSYLLVYSNYTEPDNYITFAPVKTAVGNSILITIKNDDSTNMLVSGGVINKGYQSSQYSQNNFIRYTDPFSQIDKISIIYGQLNNSDASIDAMFDSDGTCNDYDAVGPLIDTLITNTINYPKYTITKYNDFNSKGAIKVLDYEVKKDTFEKLNISLRIPFVAYDNDTFINSEFIKDISILGVQETNKQYYIFQNRLYSPITKYSKISSSNASNMIPVTMTLYSATYPNILRLELSRTIIAINKSKSQLCLCALNDDGNYDVLVASIATATATNAVSTLYLVFSN